MRIAFVSQSFDAVNPGALNSVGLVTHNLAAQLAREHEVVVYASLDCAANRGTWTGADGVTYRLMPSNPTDRLVERAWPRVMPTVARARRQLLPPLSTAAATGRKYALAVARDLAGERFDVVDVQHATQLLPHVRAAAPDATVVLHAQAEWFPQTPRATLRERFRHADLVVACSDFVRSRAVAYLPELTERCLTVHNGVDVDALDASAGRAIRPSREPFLLTLGALSPHKGVHDALAAFVAVAPHRPELTLRVVGPPGVYPIEENFPLDDHELVRRVRPLYRGDYLDKLRRAVPTELAPRVTFTGRLSPDSLMDHLLTAELLLFPSIWDEGFGLPALEALAAGTPVVATRSGGVPEFVIDGTTGFVVDKGDTAALAAATEWLLEDRPTRERLGRAGRALARERFAWPVIAGRLLDAYALAMPTTPPKPPGYRQMAAPSASSPPRSKMSESK